eukprot:Platyproteum_vivax@DN6199_c1_g1_i2.p1
MMTKRQKKFETDLVEHAFSNSDDSLLMELALNRLKQCTISFQNKKQITVEDSKDLKISNVILSAPDIEELSTQIEKTHCTPHGIIMDGCHIQGLKMSRNLGKVLSLVAPRLKFLDLSENFLENSGLQAVVGALEKSNLPQLKELHLYKCHLSGESAGRSLGLMLAKTCHNQASKLEVLNLWDNPLGPAGIEALALNFNVNSGGAILGGLKELNFSYCCKYEQCHPTSISHSNTKNIVDLENMWAKKCAAAMHSFLSVSPHLEKMFLWGDPFMQEVFWQALLQTKPARGQFLALNDLHLLSLGASNILPAFARPNFPTLPEDAFQLDAIDTKAQTPKRMLKKDSGYISTAESTQKRRRSVSPSPVSLSPVSRSSVFQQKGGKGRLLVTPIA